MTIKRTPKISMINAAILLLAPFLVFLRHNGYPLATPESVTAMVAIFACGLLYGLLIESGGQYTRVLGLTFLVVLTTDIQMLRADRGLVLWLVFGGSAVALWFLRPLINRYGTWIVAAVLTNAAISEEKV